ncbi:HSP20 family protein [Pedobacter sp. UYP30]|uniref:Hsp20/alpha crystallin family protein n=1 Tax=Pedobacter sp. UYP30 TaxID=1756400 RepID=UPI003395BE30
MTLVNFNQKTRNNAPYFNNVLESLFNDVETKSTIKQKVPAVNISESEESYIIDLAAPGLKKDDFQIKLKKDTLTVAVEEKQEENKENQVFSRREFSYGNFSRSFNLPENAANENISAAYLDGILTIKIAKQDEKLLQKEIAVS